MHENTSLDEVFKRICIPILLTYDSSVVKESNELNEEYIANIRNEIVDSFASLRAKLNTQYKDRFSEDFPLVAHVILIPLEDKMALISALDDRLKALQI